MKTHQTTTLDTSAEFRNRFDGAHKAALKLKPMAIVRHGPGGRWRVAHLLWHKIKEGKVMAGSVDAVRNDYAKEFRFLESTGGRLPSGV